MSNFVFPNRFKDKVAIVTGGAMGIGACCAIDLAAEGAKVVIVDREDKEGKETLKKITDTGAQAIYVHAELRNEQDNINMVKAAVDTFGRIDVCANIAGIGSPGPAFTADMKLEDFKYCLENNVVSIFLSMKYEIQQMLKQGGGSICNAASVGAIVGVPNAGDYIGTKHAILGMTRSAAVEYAASGIRVNAIGPHVSKTRMLDAAFAVPGLEEVITGSIPMKRVSDPDEPARATLFLLSDEASYITGQLIVADGGWTAG